VGATSIGQSFEVNGSCRCPIDREDGRGCGGYRELLAACAARVLAPPILFAVCRNCRSNTISHREEHGCFPFRVMLLDFGLAG